MSLSLYIGYTPTSNAIFIQEMSYKSVMPLDEQSPHYTSFPKTLIQKVYCGEGKLFTISKHSSLYI